MLRTAASRLVARAPARQLSTSPISYVRIRSSNSPGGTSNPNPTNANGTTQPPPPSPAEAPPAPPPETTRPSTFIPEVRQSTPTATQTPTSETSTPPPPPSESNTPLTPPAAEAETLTEEVIEPKDGKYTLPSLDIDPEVALPEPVKESESGEAGGGKKRTGAGRKDYVSSIERQRKMWARTGMGAAALGALVAAYYASQEEEGVTGAAGSDMSSWERLKTRTSDALDYFNKPAFKTLLPDPLPPPHQRPYTLVIDLEGLLVSSSWDRVQGWRTAKRPGVDYFLAYLSQFYEIVLFTSQPLYTAMPVAEKLDPFTAYLPYRLYRESTRYVSGKVVKDLSYLNRDLSKVIMIDTNAEHANLQPENAVIIKPWEGKGNERGLIDLIPFLESIAIFNTPDVRPIIKAYEGKDIPIEYAKKEEESKRAAIEEWERKNPNRTSASGGFMGGMFGSVSAPGQSRPNQPMTYLDQKRAQAQKMYQEEQKYWAENAEEFKKLIEEDKQRQMAEMKGSLLGFIQGGGGPKPEEKKA